MNNHLPAAFCARMNAQLGLEAEAFFRSLGQPPVRGIRLNPMKRTQASDFYSQAERIPWTRGAYYLEQDSDAGATILHEAGAFYIQEPGAMIPAAVLDAKPGETILDLCAAPGGKSTQIGCAMKGEGLLVCNEPVPKRARILSRNIERMGIPNAVVTCAWPEQLSKRWPGGFDAVLADAPCSGEGMFRRDPATREEWSAEKAEGCAARQREILEEAAKLVRPGGRLVYSTCTYHPAENEGNAGWFLETHPDFMPEAFFLPSVAAPDGMFTCYPHLMKGEGQFAALFRKRGDSPACLPADESVRRPSKEEISAFADAFPSLRKPTHLFGRTLVSVPFLPDLKGINSVRIGLHLGEIRGRSVIPDHAAALCFDVPDIPAADLSPEEAAGYMFGETVFRDARGWLLMRYNELVIGWGKGSEGMIKNHYPKGLRRAHYLP